MMEINLQSSFSTISPRIPFDSQKVSIISTKGKQFSVRTVQCDSCKVKLHYKDIERHVCDITNIMQRSTYISLQAQPALSCKDSEIELSQADSTTIFYDINDIEFLFNALVKHKINPYELGKELGLSFGQCSMILAIRYGKDDNSLGVREMLEYWITIHEPETMRPVTREALRQALLEVNITSAANLDDLTPPQETW